jgi:hypothetical protein
MDNCKRRSAMRGLNKRVRFSMFLFGVFFALVGSCLANPIYQPFTGMSVTALIGWGSSIFLVGFLPSVLIEYTVIYFFLKRPKLTRWPLFKVVLLINLVTIPSAQVLWWYLVLVVGLGSFPYHIEIPILLLESLVCVSEFFFLKWQFARFTRRGFLREPVPLQRTLLAALTANVMSFVVGLPGAWAMTDFAFALHGIVKHWP